VAEEKHYGSEISSVNLYAKSFCCHVGGEKKDRMEQFEYRFGKASVFSYALYDEHESIQDVLFDFRSIQLVYGEQLGAKDEEDVINLLLPHLNKTYFKAKFHINATDETFLALGIVYFRDRSRLPELYHLGDIWDDVYSALDKLLGTHYNRINGNVEVLKKAARKTLLPWFVGHFLVLAACVTGIILIIMVEAVGLKVLGWIMAILFGIGTLLLIPATFANLVEANKGVIKDTVPATTSNFS